MKEQLNDEQKKALEIPEATEDLTGQRDSRVLPLVKSLFKDLGSFAFNFSDDVKGEHPEKLKAENESYDDFYEQKFITSVLERDLQLKDMNYLFIMIKTAVSMLKEVMDEPTYSVRVMECAKEVFALMGEEKTLNLAHREDKGKSFETYTGMYERVIKPTFDKHNIQYNEVSLVFTIMQAMLAQVEIRASNTIESAKRVADAMVYGVDDIDYLTVDKVRKVVLGEVE